LTIVPAIAPTLGIVGSSSGATSANFESTGIIPEGASVILNSNGSTIFDLSAATGNVDVTFKGSKGGSALLIFEKALSADTTVGKYLFSTPASCDATYVGAQTDQVKVAATGGPYTKFAADATTGTVTNAHYQLDITDTCPAGSPVSAKKVLWTLAGNFTGISAVNGSAAGVVTGSSSTGDQTGGTANKFLIATDKLYAYASNTAAGNDFDPKPQFVIDGTTAQSARSFTVQIDVLTDGTTWTAHTAKSATTLETISRDGVSFVCNSLGPRNTVKITDRSGNLPTAGGSILVTAYDVDGNLLTEVSGAPSLVVKSNETVTITGTDLAARFSGTPMKYEFAVQTASAVVTNVKVSTDGTMTATTVYANANDAI
jgi:hypothetical protein